MLKQIKTLGLSLIIGSMIVTSVPTITFADNNKAQQVTVDEKTYLNNLEKGARQTAELNLENWDESKLDVQDVFDIMKNTEEINKFSIDDINKCRLAILEGLIEGGNVDIKPKEMLDMYNYMIEHDIDDVDKYEKEMKKIEKQTKKKSTKQKQTKTKSTKQKQTKKKSTKQTKTKVEKIKRPWSKKKRKQLITQLVFSVLDDTVNLEELILNQYAKTGDDMANILYDIRLNLCKAIDEGVAQDPACEDLKIKPEEIGDLIDEWVEIEYATMNHKSLMRRMAEIDVNRAIEETFPSTR
jgi:hypothetical protein